MSGYKNSPPTKPGRQPQPDLDPDRVGLEELLRRRVRELRESKGLTRDQLAHAMGGLGFDWNADHVAAVERGRAKLGLPAILGLAHVLDVGWPELVEFAGGEVDITETWSALGDDMAGVCAMEQRALHISTMTARESEEMSQGLELMRENLVAKEVAAALAERLGRAVGPEEVAKAAGKMWGGGIVAERDRRAERPEATPRQRQAHRAHATRQMLKELEDALR